jgi:arsenite methyltransferase
MSKNAEQIRGEVRRKYADIARTRTAARHSCCGAPETGADTVNMIGDAYDGTAGYVAEADLGLGCGLPVEHAGLQPGQTVLDLGCGAGLDAFVARNEVGATGRVIGVDMTAEMIAKARDNAAKLGVDNVEFRLGEIEHLPVRSGTVDVVISNCVLNLVPDKRRAFAGCVSGAIPKTDYLDIIAATGFGQVTLQAEKRIEVPADLLRRHLTPERRSEAESSDLHVMSVTVTAVKTG